MTPMAKEVVLVLVRDSGDVFVSFDLGSRRRKEIDIHCVPVIASAEGTKVGSDMGAT